MKKTLPLVGYKSLRALNAFHMIMMGLKMIPIYAFIKYEDFYAMFDEKSDEEKEHFLREGLAIIKLEDEEIETLLGFCEDPNGIAYGKSNSKNLDLKEIYECCLSVMVEISKIKISLITEEEKKNLTPGPSILEKPI